MNILYVEETSKIPNMNQMKLKASYTGKIKHLKSAVA